MRRNKICGGFWLVTAIIFFIGEIITIGFLLFWFGIGALFAMLTSFFTANLFIQSVVFLVTSTILLFATKPFLNKFASNNTAKTNAFSIIGKKAIVINDIEPSKKIGQIKVGGEIWSAESEEETPIPKEAEVEITKIDGVKAIVKPISPNNFNRSNILTTSNTK